jgi:PknH-like extracellular domain
LALALALVGCTGRPATTVPPQLVPDSALGGLLLDVAEVDAIMASDSMRTHPPVAVMGDHRNLLPNLNCLGVWQVNEAPIYDPSHYKAVRQQMLRTPDSDQWDLLVVQSVVSYRTADGPRYFLTESADKWAKCTNHHVNIQLNDRPLPAWKSGDLTTADNRLAMPYARGSGDQTRSCQHVLQTAANVIIDVAACGPPGQPFTKAAEVAARIEAKMPR